MWAVFGEMTVAFAILTVQPRGVSAVTAFMTAFIALEHGACEDVVSVLFADFTNDITGSGGRRRVDGGR